MSQTIKRWGLLVGAAGAVLALDQGAKYLVMQRLALGESWAPLPVLDGWLLITRSFNTGAAFGMLPMASDFFLILALITVAAFVIGYPHLPDRASLSRLAVALVVGGALSNAIDRLRFDHVIDYVHVQITPTFSNISNFGDHAITLGVILLLMDQWLIERRKSAEEPALQAAASADASTTQADRAGPALAASVSEPIQNRSVEIDGTPIEDSMD